MLVLSRLVGERIEIGNDIVITVVGVYRGGKVRIGIEAPSEVTVHRSEIADRIRGIDETSRLVDEVFRKDKE